MPKVGRWQEWNVIPLKSGYGTGLPFVAEKKYKAM
jgi:hypothetical protein